MLDYPILTPENVLIEHTLAGPLSRMMAWIVDLLVLGMLLSGLAIVAGFLVALGGELGQAVYATVTFLVVLGYWTVLEHRWAGQTVGKRLLSLRVVGRGGLPLTWAQVILRNLLRPLDLLPGLGGVGGLSILVHPEGRRLGDLVAGTVVIRERKPPAPGRILGSVAERRRAAHPIPVSVRRQLGIRDREFLLELGLRRDQLELGVRVRLFGDVAAWLRELGLEQPRGMSDEKLTVLVVGALFADGPAPPGNRPLAPANPPQASR